MKTIFIVEDDQSIGDMLQEVLQKEGFRVQRAYSGTEAALLLGQDLPDLVLLDLMLPGLPGEELLDRLQGVPVIVVSAKAGLDDKVDLLLRGAADYITKPFEIRELLARVQVQLRRSEQPAGQALEAGGIRLNVLSREAEVNGQSVHLTRTEYAILKLLMCNPGQAVSKAAILDNISQDTPDCTDASLKQHVSNLRKKLRQAGGREYIQAVWGIGFRLDAEGAGKS